MDYSDRLMRNLCLLSVCMVAVVAITRPTAITLNNNGYEGILVAIHPDVAQSTQLIDFIKTMFLEGSSYLYTATEKRAYFKDVTILVPYTWTPDPSWAPSTSELYNNADVIIQDPLVTRRKRSADASYTSTETAGAYTWSYGGCGQSGVRINLFTDIFGTRGKIKYGPPGRLLVHEWAHYRWGVFDEYAQDGEPQFYFSPTSGQLEAVRCNINMLGRIYKTDPVTGHASLCQIVDPATGMYDENCIFNPYTIGHFNDNITASIMDRQNVPTIVNFCNDDKTDPKRIHNYESPSRHNRLCGSQSTWAVISGSPDFKDSNNPPRDIADTSPTFKVVRLTNARRMVLAVDASASMEADEKLTKARQAATSFIEDALDDEASVGVVSFSSEAKLVSPIAKLGDQESRTKVTRTLPTTAEGETSVGAALLKAIEVLKSHDQNATDAFIIVITDGQETTTPKLSDVMHQVTEAGAVVSVIAFADDETRSLERLTAETGGRYYFDSNQEMSTSAVDAMLDVYSLFDPGNQQLPVQILSQTKMLGRHESLTGSFFVDPSLGKNTRVIFTYTQDLTPNVTVLSPSGRRYCSLYPEYSLDSMMKRIKITIPFMAEVGKWTYIITNENNNDQRVSIMVLSSGRDPTTPTLKFSGDIILQNNTWPIRSTIIAEVSRGGIPVKNLKVMARVTRPMAEPHVIELFDSGAGADAVKDDGVYSRFFTQFTISGCYSVSIQLISVDVGEVTGKGIGAKPIHLATAYAGSINIHHPRLPSRENFHPGTRVVDEFPPMRITDLRVLHTSRDNGTIVLAWTAPGDDGDWDRASSYNVLMSPNAEALMRHDDLPSVDKSFVVRGDLSSPKPFGEKEEIKLKLNVPQNSNVSMVFSVFAVDESGNRGELSNFVTVGLGYVPDVNTLEYLQEGSHDEQVDFKAAPKGQKVVIASVVGSAAALLALTLIVTVVVQYVTAKIKRKREMRMFYNKEKNGIV